MDDNGKINSLELSEKPIQPLSRDYLALLLKGKRSNAVDLIMETVESGAEISDIYLDVFQRTQYEIGYLWQTNQISVAQEHFSTAVTQSIMAQLYPHIIHRNGKDREIVIACVGGELHELGARMVADFFEMDGWQTYFVGANTPAESLLETIQKQKPDVFGVSVTISYHIPEAKQLIDMIKNDPESGNQKIMVGGRAFNTAPGLWKKFSADAFAKNMRDAVSTANGLFIDTIRN